jgi:acyl dehydratase
MGFEIAPPTRGRSQAPWTTFSADSQAAVSVFGGLVTSTVSLFAIPVKIGMEDEPTAAVSNLGMTNLVNHTPARTGDQPRVGVTVTGRRLSKSRPGEGVVSFRRTPVNQREPVVSNENTALIQCRPA